MTFEELGATLKAEREKRNLNIDEVANHLKINARQLRALENGDLSSLPHPAYVKGFIRSYATSLGMSQAEIQDALNEINGTPTARKSEEAPAAETREIEKGASHKGLAFFVVLCLLAGGAYYAWDAGYFDKYLKESVVSDPGERLQSADAAMAAKDAELKAAREAAAKDEESRRLEREKVEAERRAAEEERNAGAERSEEKTAPSTAVPETGSNKSPEPAVAESAPETSAAADSHKLVITAIEECWVHSNTDKSDTRQFSLRKGDTFALPFSQSLELKLGNAGGVRLRYDGVDLPPPGSSGQVRTLVFPPKENQ